MSGSGSALWAASFRGCCVLCTFTQQMLVGCRLWSRCVLDWLLTVRWKVEPDLPLVIRLSGQGTAGCLNLCTVGIGDSLLRALLTCYSAPSLTSTPQMPVATSGGRSKQLSQVVTKIFPDIVRCPWGAKSTPAENLRDGPLNKTGITLRGHNHCVRLE